MTRVAGVLTAIALVACGGLDDHAVHIGPDSDDGANELDTHVRRLIEAANQWDWPDSGGPIAHQLPYVAGVHMGITQGTECGGHDGSLAGSVDFNVTGAYEAAHGLAAVSSATGTVVFVEAAVVGFVARSYGNHVLIRHPDGTYTIYAHLAYGTIAVRAGEQVCAGQVLGVIGATGAAFGEHLHYELRGADGDPITPWFVELPDVPVGCYPCATATHLHGCWESTNVESCGAGPWDAPGAVSVVHDPSVPWNLIRWSPVAGAFAYRIYWGTSSGIDEGSMSLGETDTTEFGHTGIVPGATYHYRVAARYSDGQGPLSDEVHVTVPVANDCEGRADLLASGTVSWQVNDDGTTTRPYPYGATETDIQPTEQVIVILGEIPTGPLRLCVRYAMSAPGGTAVRTAIIANAPPWEQRWGYARAVETGIHDECHDVPAGASSSSTQVSLLRFLEAAASFRIDTASLCAR